MFARTASLTEEDHKLLASRVGRPPATGGVASEICFYRDQAARINRDALNRILEEETRAGSQGVAEAYRGDFHTTLAPDLSAQRLAFLGTQKDFLYLHGFLEADFDIADWVDPRPLQAAHQLLARRARA